MKRETYLRMTGAIASRPPLTRAIRLLNTLVTRAIYLAYPCLLVWLGACAIGVIPDAGSATSAATTAGYEAGQDATTLFWKALLVPAVSFALLTLLRRGLNWPRPYEVFEAQPIIAKGTHGKSFPSRHVFSIFVIGTTFVFACPLPAIGWIVLALGVLLAVLRVVAGVHFPRDVVVGAALGVLCGCVGFLLF